MADFTISNPNLDPAAIERVPVAADNYCPECRARGFMPRVWQENCPECRGGDEYGDSAYCAECQYCCGC